jgi:hypothetical protein
MSGIRAPPIVALFAVSEATIPSMIPVPNLSGCFDFFDGALAQIDVPLQPPGKDSDGGGDDAEREKRCQAGW